MTIDKIEIRLPEDFKQYSGDSIMSNFDHQVIEETATAINGEKYWSHYDAWNFSGSVWYQGGKWHCEIWQYHSYMETISADTPEELMKACSDKYGND